MFTSRFRYLLEIRNEDGLLHREEVSDFLPCYEDILFAAVCDGDLPNDGAQPQAAIEPAWKDEGTGLLAGITVTLPPRSKAYGAEIFAWRVWSVLLEKKLVADDAERVPKISWSVSAHEYPRDDRPRRARISLSRAPYPFASFRLADFGIQHAGEAGKELPVFCARPLIEELCSETARSLDRERADILTGFLLREASGTPALVLTGRIEANTEVASSGAHFTFSPLTFLAAQEQLSARPPGETILAWAHNHPPVCGRDCLKVVPPCKTSMPFFSTADRAVHRASFSAPYMVALVSGKEAGRPADDPALRAFGWKDGAIVERELHICEASL